MVELVSRAVLVTPASELADVRSVARRLCAACVDSLGVDGAVLSLETGAGVRSTLWSTDAVAELIEDLQFDLGEGVCVDAARTGDPVLVPDLDHSSLAGRWPLFAAQLSARTRVGALFGLPLRWDTLTVGALGLYRRTAGPLSLAQLSDVQMAAEVAAMLVVDILSDSEQHDTTKGVHPGIGRRSAG